MTVSVNAKIAGAGSKTLIGAFEESSASSGALTNVIKYRYDTAGNYLVAVGPMTLLGVFGETTVVGSIVIKDTLEPTVGPTIMNQATVSASNVLFTSGTAPDYSKIYSAVYLSLTGNSVVDILVAPREA